MAGPWGAGAEGKMVADGGAGRVREPAEQEAGGLGDLQAAASTALGCCR